MSKKGNIVLAALVLVVLLVSVFVLSSSKFEVRIGNVSTQDDSIALGVLVVHDSSTGFNFLGTNPPSELVEISGNGDRTSFIEYVSQAQGVEKIIEVEDLAPGNETILNFSTRNKDARVSYIAGISNTVDMFVFINGASLFNSENNPVGFIRYAEIQDTGAGGETGNEGFVEHRTVPEGQNDSPVAIVEVKTR